jgi:hypothetical protein
VDEITQGVVGFMCDGVISLVKIHQLLAVRRREPGGMVRGRAVKANDRVIETELLSTPIRDNLGIVHRNHQAVEFYISTAPCDKLTSTALGLPFAAPDEP